ncbi:hypothetical protein HOLleu_21578 [Holothuria leucospilota]|uniref:Uncharacterized protein n=1 Tax=Holothuria leucospilota TaxID=206669 RepID=A0A9Q1H6X1_HOLLE|nr:hypothetical protein HOLleu_21578 [Holothuria leucospilota]
MSSSASHPGKGNLRPPKEESHIHRQKIPVPTPSVILLPCSEETELLETNNQPPTSEQVLHPPQKKIQDGNPGRSPLVSSTGLLGNVDRSKRCRDLLHLCRRFNILIRASHLAGQQNVMADTLSRGTLLETKWSLSQVWAHHVFEIFDRPMVDLFATPFNTKLPTFCTRAFHPQAWATDALAISWDNLYAYAFPPWCLIHRVHLKLRESNAILLLVAPCWPNQPWFTTLN